MFPCRDISEDSSLQSVLWAQEPDKWAYIKLLKHEILHIRYEAKHKLCIWLEKPPNPRLIKPVLETPVVLREWRVWDDWCMKKTALSVANLKDFGAF